MKLLSSKFPRRAVLQVLAVVLLLAAPGVWAHTMQVEPVVVLMRPQKTFLTVEMKGNGEDIVQAVKVQDSERDGNEGFKPAVEERLQEYLNAHLLLKQGTQNLSGKLLGLEYWRPDSADYTKSRFSLIMRYPREPSQADKPFEATNRLFDYLPNSQTILSIGGIQKTMAPGQSVTLDPSAVTTNLWNNIRDFTVMGVEHIFTGPDHMLFILALLLASTSFKSLVKTLSGFTLAHSITLILSALSVVVLDARFTDIMVALSIMYVGLENIFAPNLKHRFWVASGFGLIHGFGFSGVLREIGLPQEGLAWCLLSFNLGVEIAQVMICALAFPILLRVKSKFEHEEKYGGRSWPQMMHAASWFVVAAGGYWMLERLSG